MLGAILGYAELLELELGELPMARADAREIIVAAQRGRDLVQQLLAFSRQKDTARVPVEVPAIVTEVYQLLRASLPSSIQLTVESEQNVEPVLADATSLHRIVMNLATNAAHAVTAGGDVCIRVQRRFVPEPHARENPELREGWYTMLSVSDNGTGMDSDTLTRAREPFFTTKPQGTGTGLGLSVVHGLMQSHGGALEIESEVGAGTEVRCYFPALSPAQTERATSA